MALLVYRSMLPVKDFLYYCSLALKQMFCSGNFIIPVLIQKQDMINYPFTYF